MREHTHGHGFAEAAGASDEGHFRRLLFQQIGDQLRLIDVVILSIPNFCKVGNADRDVQLFHGRCSSLSRVFTCLYNTISHYHLHPFYNK